MSNETLIARIQSLYDTPLDPVPTELAPTLAPLDGIKAVLFDVYGTLLISASGDIGLDSGRRARILLGELLTSAGIRAPSQACAESDGDALVRDAIQAEHQRARIQELDYPEVDIVAIWGQLLDAQRVHATPDQVCRVAIEHEGRSNVVWPMPGLATVLAHLRGTGLALGIVSNAQFYTPLILEAFLGQPPDALGLDPDCSAWSYRLGVGKPSTAIYQPALDGLRRKHGIAPEQVLYIGNDRRNDIWPAARLGMRTALFAGDARSLRLRPEDPTLASVTADRVITELRQIPSLLAAPTPPT